MSFAMNMTDDNRWASMTFAEKNHVLYLKQKTLLDTFLDWYKRQLKYVSFCAFYLTNAVEKYANIYFLTIQKSVFFLTFAFRFAMIGLSKRRCYSC